MVGAIKEVGVGGLFKGVGACWARDIPFSCIYFPTYSYVKGKLADQGQPGFVCSMGAGLVAGVLAAAPTTPCDVVKTRMQNPNAAALGYRSLPGVSLCSVARSLFLVSFLIPRSTAPRARGGARVSKHKGLAKELPAGIVLTFCPLQADGNGETNVPQGGTPVLFCGHPAPRRQGERHVPGCGCGRGWNWESEWGHGAFWVEVGVPFSKFACCQWHASACHVIIMLPSACRHVIMMPLPGSTPTHQARPPLD